MIIREILFFLEVRPSLRRIPASDNALYIGDRDKRVWIFRLDIVHKLTIFLLCEDRQDLALLGIAVAAGGRVDSDAALEILRCVQRSRTPGSFR